MIRVGVIGVGSMGQNHARLYSQMECKLVGVADTNLERAREIGKKYDTEYYSDYHDLLHKVDAVSIAVPTSVHHTIATDFLAQGVHCLVEKPIASKLDQAQEMIEVAKRKGVNLAVGHIEHFNPAVVKLKKIIDEGKIGRLIMISARRVGPYVLRIRDVGIIVDSATHDIGVINYLVGRLPSNIFSQVGTLRHEIDDHAIIVLDYQGTTASVEVNWFTPHKVRTLVATGDEGIAYLDYIEQTVTLHNGRLVDNLQITKAEPLKLELEDFLQSIDSAREPLVNGEQARDILRIALQACKL